MRKERKKERLRIAGPIQCGTIYISLFTNKNSIRKHMRLKGKGETKQKENQRVKLLSRP